MQISIKGARVENSLTQVQTAAEMWLLRKSLVIVNAV